MNGLISTVIFLLAAILLYRLRDPILAMLHRFDEKNRARQIEEIQDRRDRLAHYKHTLRLAEEQVEEVNEIKVRDMRTGEDLKRYVFEGEMYATREEAEEVRQASIVSKARDFYVELPAALTARRGDKLN
ncbi:MAG: hypothetical protein HY243_16295 [Proteobacteria bacterium]|nr:hypothetical protein [Pseudomonadota bacterium]